jgi:hypothetical protein
MWGSFKAAFAAGLGALLAWKLANKIAELDCNKLKEDATTLWGEFKESRNISAAKREEKSSCSPDLH